MGPTSTAQGVDEAIGLRHANLIALLGVDQRDGRLGAWMEFLNGVTLEQQVDRNGPLLPGEVARLGMEIGAALSTLHEAGAIHRRITPSNVMLDLENRYWLAEIEIAAAGEDEGSCASSAQADISALGSVLWFAATGRTEFSRDGIARHALPSALLDAVTWAIEPEPGEEFQIARELVRTLQAMASRAAPEQRDSALGRIGGRLRRLGKSRREGA
jgi:serine/threonine protein kinase